MDPRDRALEDGPITNMLEEIDLDEKWTSLMSQRDQTLQERLEKLKTNKGASPIPIPTAQTGSKSTIVSGASHREPAGDKPPIALSQPSPLSFPKPSSSTPSLPPTASVS